MKQLTLASPHMIVMVGIPGAGKTAFAEHFAETFKTPYVNQSFLMREFRLNATQATAMANQMLKELFKTRRTILYEGDTSTKAAREALLKTVVAAGYRPLIVWVQTESLEAKRRAIKPHPKGSGVSAGEFTDAVQEFEAPFPEEHAIVISGKHTYPSQLKIVLRQLASERPEIKLPSERRTPPPRRTLVQ